MVDSISGNSNSIQDAGLLNVDRQQASQNVEKVNLESAQDTGSTSTLQLVDQAGIGNTGFACAKLAGSTTLMSLSSTCVLTGAAPWFWPLTNLVGP